MDIILILALSNVLQQKLTNNHIRWNSCKRRACGIVVYIRKIVEREAVEVGMGIDVLETTISCGQYQYKNQ